MYDKNIIIQSKNRIAKDYKEFNFLKKYSSEIINKKLKSINLDFAKVLEIGFHTGELTDKLEKLKKIKTIISTDISIEMIKYYRKKNNILINIDEECLSFKEECFDGVFSCLYLNHINDYEKFFLKINKILKKNSVFLFSIFGSETIKELKSLLFEADNLVFNGVYPRFNLLFDIKKLGDLLFKLGFKNTVIETELINVKYKSTKKLMKDLRGMGESNFLKGRRKYFSNKSFFSNVEKKYKFKFLNLEDKTINSTFEIITAICWKK